MAFRGEHEVGCFVQLFHASDRAFQEAGKELREEAGIVEFRIVNAYARFPVVRIRVTTESLCQSLGFSLSK